ncbi:MAG: hypothetical protein IKW99_01485 [Bacteroidales bacterium]|nr:hypothetical protein [Bacteroidales bacterium]
MKKFIYYLIGVTAILAASCEREISWHEEFPVDEEGVAALSFSCSDMATRAVNGVSNENLIKRIDYFIFAYGEDGKVADDAEYVYSKSLIPTDDGLAGTYKDTIQTGVLNKIFANGSKTAKVFAVANYVDKYGSNPSLADVNTTIPDTVKTWKGLHELEVGATFFEDGGEGFELRWPRTMTPADTNLFFVMTGEKEIELNPSGRFAVQAEIPLKRLASKVTVSFTYEEFLEQKKDKEGHIYEEIKWEPMSNGDKTRVYLSNAIEHTTLGGPLSRALVADSWANCTKPQTHGSTEGNGSRDLFEYAYDYMKDLTTTDSNGNKLAHYYSYPISLDEGDDNQPYLKLVLPWQGYKNFGTTDAPDWREYKQKEVYYKIVLPRGSISEPNMIYEFSVTVNTIGSDNEVKVIGEEYVVKDWSQNGAFASNVGLGRYISLDIPKDEYDMYSNSVQILFVSSGEVEVSKLQIYDYNLTGNTATPRYFINGGPTSYVNPYNANTVDGGNPAVRLPNWVSVQGSQLVINHTLRTALDNQVNISPFKFVVTLHLKDEGTSTRFDRTVTITQYPPIYAEAVLTQNANTIFLNGTVYSGTARNVTNNASASLGYIGNSSAGKTRTIVTVTTLASIDAGKYTNLGMDAPVIGDPRIKLKDKYPVNTYTPLGGQPQSWGEQDLGNASNNYIEDYMYADPDKANVIAPKFMLASGYGGCNGNKVGWASNIERCASYQEDGYPAGRWRLPTEAEMVFVYTLANDLGLLANPFYSSSHYWASTGRNFYDEAFNTTQGGGTGAGQNVNGWSSRCVYDLWYWGEDPVLTGNAATQWSGFMTTK